MDALTAHCREPSEAETLIAQLTALEKEYAGVYGQYTSKTARSR